MNPMRFCDVEECDVSMCCDTASRFVAFTELVGVMRSDEMLHWYCCCDVLQCFVVMSCFHWKVYRCSLNALSWYAVTR